MKKFDFSIYKKSKIYFQMYDVLIKEKYQNKDHFLLDNDIPPSSYRRCKASEQPGGYDIINKLAKRLRLTTTTNEEIDEIEKFASKVYYQMTYKIYKSYEEDIEYLTNLINKRHILFPILELIRLFLYMNANITVTDIVNDKKYLFNKVSQYKNFYTNELLELYELEYIFFVGANTEELYLKTYNNSIAYTILAMQAYNRQDYIACLYFSNKAKEIAEKEGNVRRIIRLNKNILLCLLYVGNYAECYELASRQILILESLDINDNSIDIARKFLIVASVGYEKYDKVIELLEDKEEINLTEIICLMISYYKVDKKKYDNYVKVRIDYNKTDNIYTKYVNVVNNFIKKPDKKYLSSLDNGEIMDPMKKIFRKMLKQ